MTEQALRTAAVLVTCMVWSAAANAQVKTTAGMVRGATTADGRIRVFKGIPYAAAPVGELRWKEPQPAPSWDGVREATEPGAHCVQGQIFGDVTVPRRLNAASITKARQSETASQ